MTAHMELVWVIFFCIAIEALYQLCFKHAAHASGVAQAMGRPITWLGIALWLIEMLTWAYVLEFVPLSTAFPLMSLTYVTTLIASACVFKERVTGRQVCGALLITAGVACVGVGGI